MAKFQETEKAVQLLDELLQSLNKTASQTADILIKLNDAIKKQSTSSEELKQKETQLITAEQKQQILENERIAVLNKLKIAVSDSAKKNEEIKVQLSEQQKVNKNLAKDKLGLIGAYQKESQRLNELRTQYKNLAVQGKENSKEARNLKNEITGLDAKLKQVDATVGQHQRNVGNYSSAMSALPGPIGSVITSIKTLSKAIFASPIGWVIGAIGAVVGAVKTFFTNSEEGQDRWNITMQKAKVIWGNVKDTIADAGGAVVGFVDEIIKSDKPLQELGNKIKALGDRMWEGLKGVGNEIKELVQGEGSWKELGNAAIQTFTGIENGVDKINKKLEEGKRERELAGQLAERQNALHVKERENLVKIAELNREISRIRLDVADREGLSAQQRIELTDKANALELQSLKLKEDYKKEQIALMKIEQSFSGTTKEGKLALAQLEAELIDLETESNRKRRKFEAERQTAIREIAAAEEAALKEAQEKWDKYFDDLSKANDDFTAELDASNKSESDILAQLLKDDEERTLQSYKDKTKAALDYQKAVEDIENDLKQQGIETIGILFDLRTNYRDAEISALEKQRDYEVELAKEKGQSTANIEKRFADKEKELRKKQAKQDKIQALFNAAINIATGITKTIATLGMPAAIPFVIAAGILGGIQLAAIAKTKEPGFKDGTHGPLTESVYAKVSEQGQEYFRNKKLGIEGLTPKFETKAFIPEGTEIFPAYSKETKEAKERINNDGTITELRQIRKALSGKREKDIVTRQGAFHIIEQNNQRIISRKRLIN